MISKEKIWDALRLKIPYDELFSIYQEKKYEKDCYYDFNLILEVFHKTINKELDFDYFHAWTLLLSKCLCHTYIKSKTRLRRSYYDIGCLFDAIAFMSEYDKKELLSYLAYLKYHNYEIELIKKERKKGPFLTNGIERIVLDDHTNLFANTTVYRVIIKDYTLKKWDIRYVDSLDFDFDENINYSFPFDDDFEEIFHDFFGKNDDWEEDHNLKF